MKLITYRYEGEEAIGIFVDDRVIPMTELGVQEKTMLSFIQHGGQEQLAALEKEAETEISELLRKRRMLYRENEKPPDVAVLNERLRVLRNTAKLCREIAEQSAEMEKRMQAMPPVHQQQKENFVQERER